MKTACPLDCPDACTLDVELRGGRILMRGDDRNAVTNGLICGKVRRVERHLKSPERLTSPMRRTNAKGQPGTFAPITWDEALEVLVGRLEALRDTPERVLACAEGGSNGPLTQGTHDTRFFSRYGASEVKPNLCAAPMSAAHKAMYGRMPGLGFPAYEDADLIVLWGHNPHATSVHLWPYVQRALARGAKLIVVDPRAIKATRHATHHLALRPGTDLPLALGLLRWCFENDGVDTGFVEAHTTGIDALRALAAPWTLEATAAATGVDAAQIVALAELWLGTERAALRVGYGPERNQWGTGAMAAVMAIPAVTGKFGHAAGLTASNSGAWSLDTSSFRHADPPRQIPMSQLGRALTAWQDPAIALVIAYNGNPVVTAPDQGRILSGLARPEVFTVVHEVVMTDTARQADLVLPATHYLEHDDLAKGYGALSVARVRPVLVPPPLARSNAWLFDTLSARLGLLRPEDPTAPDDVIAAVMGAHPEAHAGLLNAGQSAPPAGIRPTPFVDVFPQTTDGRVHLVPDPAWFAWSPTAEAGKLQVITPGQRDMISSTFGQLHPTPKIQMHPDDAAARGLSDGQRVLLRSAYGAAAGDLELSAKVRPGVLSWPKGAWREGSASSVNALIGDALTHHGDGPRYHDVWVEVVAR